MGQFTGQQNWDRKKKNSSYFSFSLFSCIFALSDTCLDEYGHEIAVFFTYSRFYYNSFKIS